MKTTNYAGGISTPGVTVEDKSFINGEEVPYGTIQSVIHFKYEPTRNAMNFLEQVQQQVNELGITIECHISGENN